MNISVKSVATGTHLAGGVLLSNPDMKNDTFRRSAVFVLSHSSEGAMGVILNRPSGRAIGEAVLAFCYTSLSNIPLYFGGPVQADSFMFAAWYGNAKGGHQMKCGLSREQASDILSSVPDAQLRCFHGHAAWAPGQLETELNAGGWVVAPLDFNILNKTEGVSLWQKFLREYHPSLYLPALGPDDPGCN